MRKKKTKAQTIRLNSEALKAIKFLKEKWQEKTKNKIINYALQEFPRQIIFSEGLMKINLSLRRKLKESEEQRNEIAQKIMNLTNKKKK